MQSSLINNRADKMLSILNETNEISNKIFSELSTQTETFDRIEKNLNRIDQNISISSQIINRMISFFSFFSSATQESEVVNIPENVQNNANCDDKIITDYEKSKKGDKFDEILMGLANIKSQAILHGEILSSHNERSQKMLSQIDKNMNDMKKLSADMKKI